MVSSENKSDALTNNIHKLRPLELSPRAEIAPATWTFKLQKDDNKGNISGNMNTDGSEQNSTSFKSPFIQKHCQEIWKLARFSLEQRKTATRILDFLSRG